MIVMEAGEKIEILPNNLEEVSSFLQEHDNNQQTESLNESLDVPDHTQDLVLEDGAGESRSGDQLNSDIEEQGLSLVKIINTPPDSVNDLSKHGNNIFNGKDLTLHNISDENLTPRSETDGPMMKPDRTPLRDKKVALLEKLTEVLKPDSEKDSETRLSLKSSLLDRLRILHRPDPYHVLPSPESSTSEEGGREEQDTSGVTETLLSVIEEVEQQLDLGDQYPESSFELILSRIESEAQPGTLRRSDAPCTDCSLCKDIVGPIHKLAVRVADMNKLDKCNALIKLWREIKSTMKSKHISLNPGIMAVCRPCVLCCDICTTYHEYVESNSLHKRTQIREDFAEIIKKMDPSTQVVMNSSVGNEYQHRPLCVPKHPTGTDRAIDKKSEEFKKNQADIVNEKEQRSKISTEKSLCDQVDTTNNSEDGVSETTAHQMTSEFDSLTGESLSSDDLDTSAGVKTIPHYETVTSKISDSSWTQSTSKPISEKMKKVLIMQINRAISKEVRSLKKDLTSRILGTLSPSLSHTDLRSIEKAVNHPDLGPVPKLIEPVSKDDHEHEVLSSNPTNSNLRLSPIVPMFPRKSLKPSKFELLRQLPIAEEDNKERKLCLLANMNKPPPKNDVNSLAYQNQKQSVNQNRSNIPIVVKETISSEESPSVTAPALPIISNSGLIHIKKKDSVTGKKHKIKVSVKPRNRDNTLSNMTFPLDEEVSELTDIPPCLMESMDLSLYSRRNSDSVSSQTSDTVQETRRSGGGTPDAVTVGSEGSRSYRCVCDHWEYDYEADISDHEEDEKVVEEDPGSISQTEDTETGCKYISDESGGRTDFTAYTAVIPKKMAKSTPNKTALPKKIKLDLPRSLTKNSPSSFLLKGPKDQGTTSNSSNQGDAKIKGKTLASNNIKSSSVVKLSKIPKSKPQSVVNTLVGSEKSIPDNKKGTTKNTGKISNLSMPKSHHQSSSINSKGALSTVEVRSQPRVPGTNASTGTAINRSTANIKQTQSRLPAGTNMTKKRRSDGSNLKQNNTTQQLSKVPSPMPKQKTVPIKGMSSKISEVKSPSYIPKSGVTGIHSHVTKNTGIPQKCEQNVSSMTSRSSKMSTPRQMMEKPVTKPTKSSTQFQLGISRPPKPKTFKTCTKSSSTSTISTSKQSSLIPIPIKKSVSTSNNMVSKPNFLRRELFSSKSSLSSASSVMKTNTKPQTNKQKLQKTLQKSKSPEKSVSNSKQSSSFDSGIASSRTKSFRVTQVAKSGGLREGSSKIPDSMTRLNLGRSSPAVSITFPNSRKLAAKN